MRADHDEFDAEWDRIIDATLGVSTPTDYAPIVDVHVLLLRGTDVLLVHRANTGISDGMWALPCGRLRSWEALPQRASREVREQLALFVPVEALHFAHVTHHRGMDDRIGFYFTATEWSGQPHNAEPDRHDTFDWFDLDHLPRDLISYCATGITHYRQNVAFSLHNWTSD